MPQHAGRERLRDRIQGHSALAGFQRPRRPLVEFEAKPQADLGEAPAQKTATKLRRFDRCERKRPKAAKRPGSGPFGPGGIPKAAKAFGGVLGKASS